MNRLTLTLGIAAFAAISAPLSAQGKGRNSTGIPPGQMPPAGMCRIWIDGVPPGRQPRPTDCATAQRNVPVNGRVIYGDNSRGGGKYGRNGGVNNGVYDRNGDGVIDSRDRVGTTGCAWYDVNCRLSGSGSTSGWSQIGQDRYGNTIYERRRTDRNGNVIVETARRDSNGRLVIINTRRVSSNDTRGVYDTQVYDGNRSGDNDDQGRYDAGKGKGHGNGNGKYKNKNR
jgi:hypothetical protein